MRHITVLEAIYVHASGQRVHIDSLCLLLARKEQLLDTVMHTFSRFVKPVKS